ncbi:hypothetical protein KAM622c_40810 [Klebsiella quasipneumoniae subsp. quasipneumoniae]|nr:hypothetical protein KAM622c_40810 [Klebsiella quasipneumoniae subsp. quasipneumoniae]
MATLTTLIDSGTNEFINWRAIPPTVKDCQLRIVKGLILSHETPPPPLGRSKVTALFYGFGRREKLMVVMLHRPDSHT